MTEEISENTILHKLNGEENYSQCVRKNDERVRTLHEKLMSREKMKQATSELKKEVEEKHARAASRHEAFVAQVVKKAGDEIRRINEVRIITSLNEEKKKLMLRQKLHESELRRAEQLAVMKSKQKENLASNNSTNIATGIDSSLGIGNIALQPSIKRRIKRIGQRLMALKYEFVEPPLGGESAGIGYRVAVGAARAKVGRWLQELQRLRQEASKKRRGYEYRANNF